MGSRIGGKPPHGSEPVYPDAHNRYFGTLCFDDGFAITIYYSLDRLGQNIERDILRSNNRILLSSALIQAVVHKATSENPNSPIDAEVTCHQLVFGVPVDEPVTIDDELVPYPKSKIGGMPFADNVSIVESVLSILQDGGYQLLAQFDTPNPRLEWYVNNFPWDPGWLQVFFRGNVPESFEFAFVIQQ